MTSAMNDFFDQYQRIDDAQNNEVARRLEAGETARAVADALGLDPGGLVAAVARTGLGGEGAEGLPLVQGSTIRPQLASIVAKESTLAGLFPGASRPDRLALAAGLLQSLDAWDASHHTAQAADDLGETGTATAWHMIAHRREPDPGNARYWVRRVDPRVTFAPLPALAAPLLTAPGGEPGWGDRLLDRAGNWNPAALIDLAGQVRPGSAAAALVRRVQRLEMLVLLGQSVALRD